MMLGADVAHLALILSERSSADEIQGQFMELLLFIPEGWAEPLQIRSGLSSKDCDKMHMTNIFWKVIIATLSKIAVVSYSGCWGEVCSVEDLQRSEKEYRL